MVRRLGGINDFDEQIKYVLLFVLLSVLFCGILCIYMNLRCVCGAIRKIICCPFKTCACVRSLWNCCNDDGYELVNS